MAEKNLTPVQFDKKMFVKGVLADMLKAAYNCANTINDVTYAVDTYGNERVYVELDPAIEGGLGRVIVINVTGDSLSAIVTDVVRVMNDKY